jgi:hypothetical protein
MYDHNFFIAGPTDQAAVKPVSTTP